MTPCSLVDEYQRFGGTYCRCLHTVLVWRWLAVLGGIYHFHRHDRCPGYEPICSSSEVLVVTKLHGVMPYITINIQFCLSLSYKQISLTPSPSYLIIYVLNYLLGAESFLIS
jgi:hypothetical protein